MPKFLLFIGLATALCMAGGCSTLIFPGVYRITVEQGNIVTQKMVDELKPGMSRDQVAYVLGTPLLKDPFNDNRWDYVYTIKRNHQPLVYRHMAVFFDGADHLKSFSGDYLPTAAARDKAALDQKANTAPPADTDTETGPDTDSDAG